MLPLPTSPIPVALVAVLVGLAAARSLRSASTPSGGTRRTIAVNGVPALATAAVAVVVWTTPVRVWVWTAAGTLCPAVAAAPFANALRVRHRAPTPAEETALSRVPDAPWGNVRVIDAEGRITGYAAGNPLTGTVTVSAGALAALSPGVLAALLAHEHAHVERRRSPGAVVSLLSSLPVDPGDRSLPRRLWSTHPSPRRRITAIRERFGAGAAPSQ